MLLKRIELIGFKSFANRTELEFGKGISAVVGPNGSGKSNISDGIRWVLGEQSARSLRGGKMEDIIFAGSDSRKAVNYGEVSLTLDNTNQKLPLDFNEITVTRRLHRNGDSEYFINKQACRLRDINELFMDTGIGREAYSIIGQGRIEEILSTRSEDRRGIFEEASGIVKFKSRKKEAEKKLEQTEQNLLRIFDLISELEDQIEPLREQSEKAVRYKELKEQLTSHEISLYVYQIEHIHSAWTAANEQLQALQHEQLQLATIVSQHDAQLETHRMKTRQLEIELEGLQEQLLHISAESEKCEGQGEVLRERQHHLERSLEERKRALALHEQRKENLLQEQSGYAATADEINEQLVAVQQRLAQEEQRLLAMSEQAASGLEEQLKAELLDTLNEMAAARNETRFVAQQLETIARKELQLDEELEQSKQMQAEITRRKEEIEKRLAEAADAIEKVRTEFLQVNEQLKVKQNLLDETQLMLRRTEQKHEALISRRDTMHELLNDYDGFVHGVKAVLKAGKTSKSSSRLQGVHGAVAELITVSEQVELAIETALGASLQYIVMENEAHSRSAISFLKEQRLGRATFLPLDVIRPRQFNEQERKLLDETEGFVGIAVDLVEYDGLYQDIMANLLGQVIIAETLEQANRIAAKVRYRYRVVTLDGDVVNAGGSMTGGSQHRKNTSLLGRKRQIEQMDEQIAQVKRDMDKLHEHGEQLRSDITQITTELEHMRQQGEQMRLDEQQVRAELASIEQENKRFEQQLSIHQLDHEALAEERKAQEAKQTELEERINALHASEASLQEAIRGAESDRQSALSAREQLQQQLTQLKIEEAELMQQRQAQENQLIRFKAEISTIQSELDESLQAVSQLEQNIADNESEQVAQIEQLNELTIKRKQCAEQIEFKRAERAQWITQLEQEEEETKDQRIALKNIETNLHQTEVKVNRLDVELDNLLRNLAEDYELSYELAKQRYPIPEDVPGTEQQVKSLKQDIARLGEVNLGAIDEYERISERFAFLSQQKQDLTEAKQKLYDVIAELEQEMSKLFQATFEEIKAHFTVVFKKLFGGGRADLILSEPQQLLETGIEIVAQPPGKKLQNLQLLSGGERALTAIALLFAILNVKPVPFCVLDEVEAALDEANVVRFGEYLKEFSEHTQFIIVTHRKGTMEAADVLYGVSMEEDGVSKLVSVRLDEDGAVSA